MKNESNKLTAVILDDEKIACQLLNSLLDEYCPEVEVVLVSQNPVDVLDEIEDLCPDIIFLDINMPKMNGFEFIEQLKDFKGKIVFTTAYDKYAIQAFKYAAFDYLMKPVHIEQLENTVERFIEETKRQPQQQNSDITQLLSVLNLEKTKSSEVLAIHNNGDLLFMAKKDITYIEGSGNYSTVYFSEGKHLSSKTLKEFETLLDDTVFIRAHKSYLVNINCVARYSPKEGGFLILKTGESIPFSRRKRHILNQFSI